MKRTCRPAGAAFALAAATVVAFAASGGRLSAEFRRPPLAVRWHVDLGDVSDASPVVAGDRLFLTTHDGTTVAVAVDDGRVLWRFRTNGDRITTSVPAYDDASRALYAPGVDGAVHRLDPADGRELRGNGFPATITLAPETEKNASPLHIANGYLYAQTSGYIGDATPYVGHVVAIRLRDGAKHVFNTLCSSRHGLIDPQSCDAQRSGMWSRAGVVVDPDPAMRGRIYVASGNGPFDARAGKYGDSILSLDDDASALLGFLTPPDFDELEARDADVGSSSPALLPREPSSDTPLLAVQAGKDRVLRLFDRAHLPGLGAPLQTIPLDDRLFSTPAVARTSGATFVYLGFGDAVRAYRLVTGDGKSRLERAWTAPISEDAGGEGTSPVVADGIVYVATSGALIALDARDGRRIARAPLGPIHWESPIVANGVVYCSDGSGSLTAFGT